MRRVIINTPLGPKEAIMADEDGVDFTTHYDAGNGNFMPKPNNQGSPFTGVVPTGPQAQIAGLGLSKWRISIKLRRLTETINEVLWVPLFGPVNQPTDYVPVLQRLNKFSAGLALEFTIDQDGNGIFTFTKGGNTDIVQVVSNTQTSYSEILQMINAGGYFTSDKIRFNTDNYAAQYAAGDILGTTNTLSGIIVSESAEIGANKTPEQFQNPIIDVNVNLAVDAVYTMVIPMADDVADLNMYFQNVLFKSPAQFSRACVNG